jgi:hypothetical protein
MGEKNTQDLINELVALKAQGYDCAAQLEALGQRMREINQAIMAKNAEVEAKRKEKPTEGANG